MTPSEILTEARRLIEGKGWTQGAFARNCDGERIGLDDPCAARFCSIGALIRSWAGASNEARHHAREALVRGSGHTDLAWWNDSNRRTVADVLSAFDRAIALAREAGR